MRAFLVFTVCSVLVLLCAAVQPVPKVPTPATFVFDAIKFGFTVFQYFDGKEKEEDASEELLNQISRKIESTSEMLYQKLLINSQLNKIEETRLEINSVMIDLKRCLTAHPAERPQYLQLFLHRANQAFPRMRYLSNHLIDHIPGYNKNIIELVADASRCNLTAFDTMVAESMELMSNGILIEMTVLRMSGKFTLEAETEFWKTKVKEAASEFSKQFKLCVAKIPKLVLEDLVGEVNVSQIQVYNKMKYRWAWDDVVAMDNSVPNQFAHYTVDSSEVLVKNSNGKTKIVTYNQNGPSHSSFTSQTLAKIVKERVIIGSDDADAIGRKVLKALDEKHVSYSAMLVYFNGEKFKPAIAIDSESPAIRVDTEKNYVEYCTSSFCAINWDNWLGVKEEMYGYFSVYVLENPSPNTSPHSFVSDGVSVYRVKYGVLFTVLSFALHFNRL